jgi:hypothetical protein
MATVYLAQDRKHSRQVAVKVIRPDLAAAVGSERFLREIEITAGLNHPHILPLLDSGDDDGLLYYVMPYVTGGSLRRLLDTDTEIPLEAVLRISGEVASALDYAHNRGVVHRDIKPENILFNEGLAVVSDFGIALAVSSAPRKQVTQTGTALGTLGYMSPEQALGKGELDSRTDVYSLGSVVYEMLCGGTPASWPGPEDVRLGRLEDVPPSHRMRLDGYPGRVEQVITKALALRPGDRYRQAGELARALAGASERTPSFTEDQVRQLLDRAAELQAQEAPDPGSMTIGAVEQVAAQVGIPPEHIRRAALELEGAEPSMEASRPVVELSPPVTAVDRPRTPGGQTLDWGPGSKAPVGLWRRHPDEKWDRVVLETFVDGEISEEAYPEMVEEIQENLQVMGHASVLANNLTWSPATQGEESRRVVVSVKNKGGQTRIRLEETYGIRGFRRALIPVGAVTGVVFAVLIATILGIADQALPGLIIPIMGLGIVGGIFGTIKFEANTRRPQLAALLERLKGIGEKSLKEGSNQPKELGPG